MELGMIGLGRMGGNMTLRLLCNGHRVVVFDPDESARRAAKSGGAVSSGSIEELVSLLAPPRAVWVMVPAGDTTDSTIDALSGALSEGDTVIDGGNSNYKDTIRRADALQAHGISMLDAGTSGGIWGLTEGYSLMVGGDADAYARLEPIFRTLAPGDNIGYGRVGPSGAGHFVKMVHNGIEYGMMQAFAEGFELMEAKQDMDFDLAQIAHIWRHGSVVRSWLLDLTAAALDEDGDLAGIQAYVEDSGEGRWTLEESIDLAVPIPVIAASLQARFRSRQDAPFGAKLLAAMRNQFGGHSVRRTE
ncbi:MAG: decarboxylating 6-phosphogluconate dehydrogenase [Chloroflexota bacterium]|nr:decarboxylating 6-phosphogluconate dehydrogenase [Chloroflexota bacterium]